MDWILVLFQICPVVPGAQALEISDLLELAAGCFCFLFKRSVPCTVHVKKAAAWGDGGRRSTGRNETKMFGQNGEVGATGRLARSVCAVRGGGHSACVGRAAAARGRPLLGRSGGSGQATTGTGQCAIPVARCCCCCCTSTMRRLQVYSNSAVSARSLLLGGQAQANP